MEHSQIRHDPKRIYLCPGRESNSGLTALEVYPLTFRPGPSMGCLFIYHTRLADHSTLTEAVHVNHNNQ